MKVNGKKFSKAYHDPVYMTNKLDHLIYKVDIIISGLNSIKEDAEEFKKDLKLHKQNMLNSVITNNKGGKC